MRITHILPVARKAVASADFITSRFEKYAAFSPSPLSLEKLVAFGKNRANINKSYRFLRKELAVRLANMMKEMSHLPNKLLVTAPVQRIQSWYQTSFEEILEYENADETETILDHFTEKLANIRTRHSNVVETMAEGVLELKDRENMTDTMTSQIQYFLDRFYMMRISIRMLVNQHTLVFGSSLGNHPRHIGCIDPNCNVLEVIHDAYENAQSLSDQYYLTSPTLDISVHEADEGIKSLPMVYVPSHLYHILFELFKNAMRAVIEKHENSPSLPQLKVLVVKGIEDITIKLSDEGGGIPRSKSCHLFEYMYSTAPQPIRALRDIPPLAGYGYGLPLARLYARYFNGDILLSSVEGYGTDAIVYLKVIPHDAQELLPVYNKTSLRVYESQLPIGDWISNTDSVYNYGMHSRTANRR